jgi:hypothetical protein
MSEISQKQFWLDEIKSIEDDVELLSGLIPGCQTSFRKR